MNDIQIIFERLVQQVPGYATRNEFGDVVTVPLVPEQLMELATALVEVGLLEANDLPRQEERGSRDDQSQALLTRIEQALEEAGFERHKTSQEMIVYRLGTEIRGLRDWRIDGWRSFSRDRSR